MSFTTAQLANQIYQPSLDEWADTNLITQAPFLNAYIEHFNNLQAWINDCGGNGQPFGFNNVIGLMYVSNRQQVVLQGPQQRAPFNDAFDDVRAHLGTQGFRLFQAAQAAQRLIRFLAILN